jgi:hypothetical protein
MLSLRLLRLKGGFLRSLYCVFALLDSILKCYSTFRRLHIYFGTQETWTSKGSVHICRPFTVAIQFLLHVRLTYSS